MARFQPEALNWHVEELGIELPGSITEATNAMSNDEIHDEFVAYVERLAPIPEKIQMIEGYGMPEPYNGDSEDSPYAMPLRLGKVYKALNNDNDGFSVSLSNTNRFFDDSLFEDPDRRHTRRTEMGLHIPIDRGVVIIRLGEEVTSEWSGWQEGANANSAGVKGYTDLAPPRLFAVYEAQVAEVAVIKADFPELVSQAGIISAGNTQEAEAVLKLRDGGKFTGEDLRAAFNLGITILENIDPDALEPSTPEELALLSVSTD